MTIKQRLAAVAARQSAPTTAAIASLIAVSLLASGCGAKENVCRGSRQHIVLVPSTSVSDLATDQSLAPDVAGEAVNRAADSCGRLTTGIQNNHTEADLELRSLDLTPQHPTTFNRKPAQRRLVIEGNSWMQATLLKSLAATPATDGSPFLGALVKVGAEIQAHGGGTATIILLGDGIDIEPAPNSDGQINFSRAVPVKLLDEFVPLLKPLKGSCVMLIAAGAASGLDDARIRAAQTMLGQTLKQAGIGFVATRSRDLPASCVDGQQ